MRRMSVDSDDGANVPRTRVLVIDDSNTIRRSAEIFLKQGGYDVTWRKTVSTRCPRSMIMRPR